MSLKSDINVCLSLSRKKIYGHKMGDSGTVVTGWINRVLNSGIESFCKK